MRNVFVRSPYNYDTDAVSRETGLDSTDTEDMCKQSFKDDCDINTIVRRFGLTGTVPVSARLPTYAMFDGIFDYHTAMNAVVEAREAFEAMPAAIRARFRNDPGLFVDFCSDKKNLDELRKMGLANAAPVVDNTPAPPNSSEVKKE